MSLDLLGANRGILITVKNAQALAAKEGGTKGAIAAAILPDTIEGVVLDKMVTQFKASLRDKGVDADVAIVTAGEQGKVQSGFPGGVLLGAGLAGAAGAAWHFGLGRILGRIF